MAKKSKGIFFVSFWVASLVTAICVLKMFFYYGAIELEADTYDRYRIFSESLLQGTLQTGQFDHKFPEGMDPYEPSGRAGLFWWDYSYYKGKQYHYASFLPALLVNIPFKTVFGFYPGPKLQVLFATFFAVFSVSALILRFLEIYTAGSADNRLSSFPWMRFIFCLCSSGILLSFADSGVYTVPAFQGLAFLSLALFCLLTSCQNSDLVWWTAASILYALAVASRPPLLFYGPVFLVACLTFKASGERRWALGVFLSAALVCAVVLGMMNFVRFENPLEFGNRYQLNEFNNHKYPFVPNSLDLLSQRLPRGLWFHLLNRPRIFSHFQIALFPLYVPPWLQATIRSPMGGDGMLGTLILSPILAVLVPLALRNMVFEKTWPSRVALALLLCSLWTLLFAASLIWVADRYALDYRLYMTLGAIAGVAGFTGLRGQEGKLGKLKRAGVYLCVCWTFLVTSVGLLAPYHG
jgi:hypothetical protein